MTPAPTKNRRQHKRRVSVPDANCNEFGIPRIGHYPLDPNYGNAFCFEMHRPTDAPMIDETLERELVDCPSFREFREVRDRIQKMPEYERAMGDHALEFGLRLSFVCPERYAVQVAALVAQTFPASTFASYDAQSRRLIVRHQYERAKRREALQGLDVIK